MLAEIQGTVKFQATTGENYVPPVQPPMQHAGITGQVSSILIKQYEAANNLLLHNWVVVSCFRRGISKNFRDALDAQYHKQLKERIFCYRRILSRQYIDHITTKWVFLDEMMTEKLIANVKRGWDPDKHLTALSLRSDKEQLKFHNNQIVISFIDKTSTK